MKYVALIAIAILATALAFSPGIGTALAEGGTIRGQVWEDLNGDGVHQPNEQGIDASIQISGPAGDLQGEAKGGTYAFTGLEPGRYTVTVLYADAAYILTAPQVLTRAPYESTVMLAPDSVEELDFGLYGLQHLPTFLGDAWKDAERIDNPSVEAIIGNKNCTGPGGVHPTDQGLAFYQISVIPASIVSGCGEPGSVIQFTLNGETANETAIWQDEGASAANHHRLTLTIGPAFAWWVPVVEPIQQAIEDEDLHVEAFIGDTLCGRAERPGLPGVLLVVPSAELVPGCGTEGATVTFTVNGQPSEQTATWTAGYGDYLPFTLPDAAPEPDPTATPGSGSLITPPDTGDAGLLSSSR